MRTSGKKWKAGWETKRQCGSHEMQETYHMFTLYTIHFREMSGELWSTFGLRHMIDIFPELMKGESRENPGTDDDSW